MANLAERLRRIEVIPGDPSGDIFRRIVWSEVCSVVKAAEDEAEYGDLLYSLNVLARRLDEEGL